MGRWGEGEMGRGRDGAKECNDEVPQSGRGGDGEMGRVRDGERERWGDGERGRGGEERYKGIMAQRRSGTKANPLLCTLVTVAFFENRSRKGDFKLTI